MIKNAEYTSVWDGGVGITAPCKVNMDTKEVFDIEMVDVEGLDVLEEEYVTINDKRYSVSRSGEDDTEYWYE